MKKGKSPESTVAAIIRRNTGPQKLILLTKRKVDPFKNKWCLPGGGIDPYESAVDAIEREVEEETGLKCSFTFLDYMDEIIPENEIHAVVLVYEGEGKGVPVKENSEISDSKWVPLTEAIEYDLAFHHRNILIHYSNIITKSSSETAVIAELNYLRREIENRFDTRNKMMHYTFILAGALLAFGRIEGFILFPILGTVLAGLWSHSDIRIHDIGTYIKKHIEPYIQGLNWENHLHYEYKRKPKIGSKQERLVISVFNSSYIVMFLLTIFSIGKKHLEGAQSFNLSEVRLNSLEVLYLISSLIITISCIIVSTRFIKTRRSTYRNSK